jgi:hypothetical protein
MNATFSVANRRALRTLLQSAAAALAASPAGAAVLDVAYWKSAAYSIATAVLASAVSWLQNAAEALKDPPTGGEAKAEAAIVAEEIESDI